MAAVYKGISKKQIDTLEDVTQEAHVFLDKQNPTPSALPL